MVESIEKLRAELDVAAFTQQTKRRSLDNCDVKVILARTSSNAYAAVPKVGGYTISPNHRPDGSAAGCGQAVNAGPVEISPQPAFHRA